jgi:hypothetical protein
MAKMEASQETAEAIGEHYNWAPCVKAMGMRTTLRGLTPMFYTDFLKE